jgi:D-alanyl-lipoteichoic acid acyltransferase DltB (MBOAT superfamily)
MAARLLLLRDQALNHAFQFLAIPFSLPAGRADRFLFSSPPRRHPPLAISFFTFTQIGYLVDVYRNQSLHYRFLDYALFVVFSRI